MATTSGADAKCNVTTLARIVERCFDYAMDGRLSQARRTKFLVAGKRLRGSLLNLISARFNDTTTLRETNARLDAINTRLTKTTIVLEKAGEVIADLGRLAAALDRLLGTAAQFL
jgi:hypothetical protein